MNNMGINFESKIKKLRLLGKNCCTITEKGTSFTVYSTGRIIQNTNGCKDKSILYIHNGVTELNKEVPNMVDSSSGKIKITGPGALEEPFEINAICKADEVKEIEVDIDLTMLSHIDFMFSQLYNLKSIKFIRFNTSNIRSMAGLFKDCINIEELDLKCFDTKNVFRMPDIFKCCAKLKRLDISSFRTYNLKVFNGAFNQCFSLEELDISNFYSPQLDDMGSAFEMCNSLRELKLGNFRPNRNTAIYNCFIYCRATPTEVIDWDINLIKAGYNSCANRTNRDKYLRLVSEVNIKYANRLSNKDNNQEDKVKLDGVVFDLTDGNVVQLSNGTGQDKYGHLYIEDITEILDGSVIEKVRQEAIEYNNGKMIISGQCNYLGKRNRINSYLKDITSLEINLPNTLVVPDEIYLGNLISLREVKITNLKIMGDLSNLFKNCAGLQRVDLSGVSFVRDTFRMKNMFKGCGKLEYVNFGAIVPKYTYDISGMFDQCYSLRKVETMSQLVKDLFISNKCI